MHEMSLCLNMLEILESSAREHRFGKVKTVVLELGSLGCVEPEVLRHTFDIASENTLAEGAILDIIEVPVRARCHHCDQLVEPGKDYGGCPLCGGNDLRLETGQELKIKELEVE